MFPCAFCAQVYMLAKRASPKQRFVCVTCLSRMEEERMVWSAQVETSITSYTPSVDFCQAFELVGGTKLASKPRLVELAPKPRLVASQVRDDVISSVFSSFSISLSGGSGFFTRAMSAWTDASNEVASRCVSRAL